MRDPKGFIAIAACLAFTACGDSEPLGPKLSPEAAALKSYSCHWHDDPPPDDDGGDGPPMTTGAGEGGVAPLNVSDSYVSTKSWECHWDGSSGGGDGDDGDSSGGGGGGSGLSEAEIDYVFSYLAYEDFPAMPNQEDPCSAYADFRPRYYYCSGEDLSSDEFNLVKDAAQAISTNCPWLKDAWMRAAPFLRKVPAFMSTSDGKRSSAMTEHGGPYIVFYDKHLVDYTPLVLAHELMHVDSISHEDYAGGLQEFNEVAQSCAGI